MAALATRTRINLKKNDVVMVIAGRDAGKQGKVLKVIPEKNRVVVQGVAFVKLDHQWLPLGELTDASQIRDADHSCRRAAGAAEE